MASTTRRAVTATWAAVALLTAAGCSAAAPVETVLTPLVDLAPPAGRTLGDPESLPMLDENASQDGPIVYSLGTHPVALVAYTSGPVEPEDLAGHCDAAVSWLSGAVPLLGDPDLPAEPEIGGSLDDLLEDCSELQAQTPSSTANHGIGGPTWSFRGRTITLYLEVESTERHVLTAVVVAD